MLKAKTRAFEAKDNSRASIELAGTVIAYFALVFGSIAMLEYSVAGAIVMAMLGGIGGVRLYMLQHDCMHNAFFSDRTWNDRVGIILSPFTLTPYKATRLSHNLHHKFVGNIDEREAFEINIMTVEEFQNAHWLRRLWYRIYRSKFVLLIVGPFVFYMILRRFPKYGIKTGLSDIILHNVMLAAFIGVLFYIGGWPALGLYLLTNYVGATLGAIIPYVVHNFEDVAWMRRDEWNHTRGSLEGTAVLDFGNVFHFLTANIAFHDLHHLNANVPCYRLKACFETLRYDWNPTMIPPSQILACFALKLYDEDNKRMVPFPA